MYTTPPFYTQQAKMTLLKTFCVFFVTFSLILAYIFVLPCQADTNHLVTAIIEIPAGTNEKWEMSPETGQIELEYRDGKPRIIQYLGYPGNYGYIDRTLLATKDGGDGDPLDVLVIGKALTRGTQIQVRVLGVLRFLDDGEQDDKLIAVIPDSPLGNARTLAELKNEYPGSMKIIQLWFSNYKGNDDMQFLGEGNEKEAAAILHAAAIGE